MVIIALLLSLALAAAAIWFLAEPERRPETAGVASLSGSESAGEGLGNQAKRIAAIHMQARLEIWSRALYGLEDFPFTGLGLGTFRRVVPVLYPLFLVAPDQDIAHAHNQFLQVGLDLGLPGLITYLALWLGAAAMLWQSWQLAPTTEARWLVLGFATALLAYLLYGFSETVALGAKPGFIFWLLLGLVTSLYRLTYSSHRAAHFVSNDQRQISNH
jgi:O-antigen ligase